MLLFSQTKGFNLRVPERLLGRPHSPITWFLYLWNFGVWVTWRDGQRWLPLFGFHFKVIVPWFGLVFIWDDYDWSEGIIVKQFELGYKHRKGWLTPEGQMYFKTLWRKRWSSIEPHFAEDRWKLPNSPDLGPSLLRGIPNKS
jgi:hypothetical protein